MKIKLKTGLLVAFIFFVCALISALTTYFSLDARPRGIIVDHYKDGKIISGKIIGMMDFFATHQTPSKFILAGGDVLNHPTGSMPFIETIYGTSLRFAVNSPRISSKTIYIIENDTGKLIPVLNK